MIKEISFKTIRKMIITIAEVVVGSFLMAAATSLVLLPNQLSTGGFTGIATILYYFLKIPMGTTILVCNIPLFIFALFRVGKKFVVNSIIGTALYSVFIDWLDTMQPITQDRFLACIYGGVAIGLGTAIILKANASTGGSDLVSQLVNSYNSDIKTSNIITIMDVFIVGLNILFFKEIEIGLYSAIAIYLMGKMIDIVFEGIYFTKMVFIISDKNEEIAKEIGDKIRKGTTRIVWKRNAFRRK